MAFRVGDEDDVGDLRDRRGLQVAIVGYARAVCYRCYVRSCGDVRGSVVDFDF